MITLSFSQYTRPLVETMHISRGGFTTRTHNIIKLNHKGHDYYSEVIGDASLIGYFFNKLSIYLKEYSKVKCLSDLFEAVNKWTNAFVYLEVHSSVHSIACAFSWLEVLTESYLHGKSIFEVLGLSEPTRNHTLVYGSNLYWKNSSEDFRVQIKEFDYTKTALLKFHLGRHSPEKEIALYEEIESESRIEKFMIDYNCGYNLRELGEVSKYINESNKLRDRVLWLEEPTHPDEAHNWKDYSDLPLAAGENHHGIYQLTNLEQCSIEWIMPDFGRTLKLADFTKLIKSIGSKSKITFHSYSSGFLAYISLLLSTSMPIDRTYYEHDFSNNALLDDIIGNSISIQDGHATIEIEALHELNLDKVDKTWTISLEEVEL